MKRPIPQLPPLDENLLRVLRAMKENQEEMMGVRGEKRLEPLPEDATLDDVIQAINALIRKLQ